MEDRKEELEQLNNVSSALLHDLRTALNSVTGFVQLLNRNAGNPVRVREYAAGISDCCREMADLLGRDMERTQILHPEPGRTSAPFSLDGLLEEVSGATARMRDERQISCRVFRQEIEAEHFLGDRALLSRILLDILRNAVLATPRGGTIRLTVSAPRSTDPNLYDLSFVVRDGGAGISGELLKRVFESESGLYNMAQIKQLTDSMGGRLSLQSIPGRGTEVYLGLRLMSASMEEKEFFEELGLRRILLAVRDVQEAERIGSLMRAKRIACRPYVSGKEALEELEKADPPYDLVLLDQDMQDMTAREFCARLTKIAPDIPVVLLSEQEELFLTPGGIEGVTEVMPKPFFFSVFRQIAVRIGTREIPEKKQESADAKHPLGGLRFLVAEDNPLNADLLKELLEMEGARCEIAGNGKAAAAMFRYRKPHYYDAILMDLAMPVENGFDSAREIRALSKEDAALVPILAMTAQCMPEDVRRALESGMDAFIEKPLDIGMLLETLAGIRKTRAGSS